MSRKNALTLDLKHPGMEERMIDYQIRTAWTVNNSEVHRKRKKFSGKPSE